jgi:hypothetical protein
MECIGLNLKYYELSSIFRRLIIYFSCVFVLGTSFELNAPAQGRGRALRLPSWHYSGMPARGELFSHAPIHSQKLFFRGNNFFFHKGIFYRPFHNGFIVDGPPFGLTLGFLPRGCLSFTVGGFPYFYYCGTYYTEKNGQYEVVAPPLGAVVESLPKGYEQVDINGQTYYTLDNVQYKPIMKDGEIWYQVIKSPTKAPDSQK